jgi:hypothetical protein
MGQLCCSIYIYVLMKPFPSRPCALKPPHFLSGRVSAAKASLVVPSVEIVCVCMFRPRPEPPSSSFTFLRYGGRNNCGAAVTGQSGSTVAYLSQSKNLRLCRTL